MGEPRYQVVEFANGKFGVHDRRDGGYFQPPSFYDKLLFDTGTWWYNPAYVFAFAQMGEAKAARHCRRLNARAAAKMATYREAERAARVMRSISCEE